MRVANGKPSRPRPMDRLAFRLAVGLCLGAGMILAGTGTWNLRTQRSDLTRLVSGSADRIAETIRRATRDAMMRNSPEEVRWMIDSIGAQPGIHRIRVLNKEGRIRSSTRPEEQGTLVDRTAEQCVACHQRDRPLLRLEREDRVRVFHAGGERILGIIAPIQNEPACASAACHVHDPAQSVLGVLDVQLSLAGVDREIAEAETRMLLGLAATGIGILLLAGFLTWRLVLKPVRRLQRATARVAAGDLSTRVEVSSADEIGLMMDSWNRMTLELKRARDELEEWGRTLEGRVRDKTRELETAHERMLLVEKMASLGKLAAVVAHEINNPLAGVRTYARLLRRRRESGGTSPPAPEGEEVRILGLIEEEAGRCGEIVRNLLLFSRTPGARFGRESPVPLLDRCALLLRHQAELKEVALEVRADADLPAIECDPSQVQQMILALAMNAIEATPAGGRVTLGGRRAAAGDGVILEVADTGCGIPPENRVRIFEPFFTTKSGGAGVGLGLAVVYGIVQRHHGRIDVDSRPGLGATFSLFLPLDQPAAPAAGRETAVEVNR